jgi:hypothetical protein
MLRRLLILSCVTMALQGCATHYHCDKFPEGSCENMSQIYEKTGNSWQDYRDHPEAEDKDVDHGSKHVPVVIDQTITSANQMVPGDPVLTNPQTLRVMVFPWKDKGKDLNYSYVWMIVRDPEWTQLQ